MGCFGSKEATAPRVSLEDIPDQPEIEGLESLTEVCGALWGIKDKWTGIRQPMTDSTKAMQDAAEWEGAGLSNIAKGLIACVCQDMKPEKADLDGFEGIIECNMEEPYIHFKPEECAIIRRYMSVVEAFITCAKNYIEAVTSVEDLIAEITEFPSKVTEAFEQCTAEIEAIGDFAEMAKMAHAAGSAAKAAKSCCQILLGDLNNVKSDLMALKDVGTEVEKLMDDKSMIKKIGEACREAKKDGIKDCGEVLLELQKKEAEDKKEANK